MLDITAALAARVWSDRQAGAEVLAEWMRRERRKRYPTAAAIATRIAFLKAGNDTWWRKRPYALAAFAALLSARPEDLLPSPHQAIGAVGFPEFPELAALLPGQEPCACRADGWLGSLADAALHQGVHAWFVAPPGGGKSLVIRLLRQRWGAGLVSATARTLSEAAGVAVQGLPLLAEVEHVEPETDAPALVEITRRKSNVCILAPFPRTLIQQSRDSRWCDEVSTMDPDWRERFVRWAQTRLPEPDRIEPEEILAWLDVVDPECVAFATPGDLLPLLARAYRAGLPKQGEGLVGLARAWLAQQMGSATDPWLRRAGPTAVEHLVKARVGRLDIPLGPLSVSEWARLLPADLTPSAPTKQAERLPSRRAQPKKRPVVTTYDATVSAKPTEAVHILADCGTLRTNETGRLDVYPSWVRIGLEREAIASAVRHGGGASSWPLWAVSETRKDAVDDALDALAPGDLVHQAERALAKPEDDLVSVAATEALFAAIGRRLLHTDWRPSSAMVPTLRRLGVRQLQLLDRVSKLGTSRPILPLTRHRRSSDDPWREEWLAGAWTFSFDVGRPDDLVNDPGWLLPGWVRGLQLGSAPRDLPFPSSATDPTTFLLLSAARRAVALCCDVQVPTEVPWLLLPWVVIDRRPEWTIGKPIGDRVVLSALPLIGELLQCETQEVCARAAATLWQLALDEGGGNPLSALNRLRGQDPIFELITRNLPLEAFQDALRGTDLLLRGGEVIHGLPQRLQRAVLSVIARQLRTTGGPAVDLESAVQQMEWEDLDLLVEFAAERYSVGAVAAARVWALDPERALSEAAAALDRGRESKTSRGNWFREAPRDRYSALLDLLATRSSSPWQTRWLMDVLPVAGSEAPRVFAMLWSYAQSTKPAGGNPPARDKGSA